MPPPIPKDSAVNAFASLPSSLRPRSRAATLLAATTILLLALLPMTSGPASAQVLPNQLFLSATILPDPPSMAVIHGDGFTPGGLVRIVFSDGAGEVTTRSLWTEASEAAYGPHGSQDPARGYVPAGTVSLAIPLEGTTVYGPNGSQDPAQGYSAGLQSFAFALCDHSIGIQAYDSESRTWSSQVELAASDAFCAVSADADATDSQAAVYPGPDQRELPF